MKTSVITEDVVHHEDNGITDRDIVPSAVPMLDKNLPYAEDTTSYICDDNEASYIGDDKDNDVVDNDGEATEKLATPNSKQGNECNDETDLDVYYGGGHLVAFIFHLFQLTFPNYKVRISRLM